MPRAAGLAAHLEKELGLESGLIKGSGGVFEVRFDGGLVFSKKAAKRFPEPGEIERAISAIDARIAVGTRPPA